MRFVFTLVFFFVLIARADENFPKILDERALKNFNPCEDFYQFSCGTWLDETVIPGDRRAVYRQSTPLDEATDKNLNKILEAYAKGDFTLKAKYADKLSDFYKSCMNAAAFSEPSLKILLNEVAKIKRVSTPQELAKAVAGLHLAGTQALFGFSPAQSLNDSTKVIGNFGQSGFALGERDYYFDEDEKSVEIRKTYQDYIAQLMMSLGLNRAEGAKIAASVMKIETALAKDAYSAADQWDPSKTNHPMTRSELQKLAPHFDWGTYMTELGQARLNTLNVDEPEFFQGMDKVLTATSKSDLKNYLIWLLANDSAPEISGTLENLSFGFWNAYLNGSKQQLPRWQHCTREVENHMGYALAEAYVQTVDGDAIKKSTESLIVSIKEAFVNDLQLLVSGADAWIDSETIKEALRKVESMSQKVGAPEIWHNYDSLQTTDTYLVNSARIAKFEALRSLAKIGKPVVKTDWDMMPWEVNAYYDRSNNEFVFPFGILQPPSLDLSASEGANLGSFGGGTIGHELTHGFDSSGSQYDSHGNVQNWWSPATLEQFQKRSQCYVEQANNFLIKEVNLKVDGAQTLEENLSDQGGVKLGYMALEKSLQQRPQSALWLGKYTERQQYWIAYAQSWCAKVTPEALRSQMTSDPHPPSEFRVNAVMMNRPEFARDFNCPVGAAMAPVNRCSIW